MPSPAALAKFAMAFMVAPLNQEAVNTPLYDGSRNTPLNRGGTHIAGNSGIYMCVDGGFSGYCRYFSNPFGQCSKFILCLCRAIVPLVILSEY